MHAKGVNSIVNIQCLSNGIKVWTDNKITASKYTTDK